MLGKLAEAFLKTEAGKAITNYVEDQPIVKGAKDFVETPTGIVVAGSTAVAAIAGLAAAGKGLPMQYPSIPLNIIHPGLSVKINVEGPLNRPTQGSLMFTFGAAPPKKKQGSPTESEKYRAETARMAAGMKFGAGVDPGRGNPVSSADAQQRQAEAKAVDNYELGRMGAILNPGASWKPGQFTPLVPGTQPQGLGMRDDAVPSGTTVAPGKDDPSKKEELPVQRKAEANLNHRPDASAEVEAVLSSSSGRPLEREVRRNMESRIGFDFSKVRIHTDDCAAASATSLGASAYTVGNDIVFASGRYGPQTMQGQRLLAHELTHVLQQQRPDAVMIQRQTASTADDKAKDDEAAEIDSYFASLYPILYTGIENQSPDILISYANNLSAKYEIAQAGKAPLTKLALASVLSRIYDTLQTEETTAERDTDGALLTRQFVDMVPWTASRPTSVSEIPVFTAERLLAWEADSAANDHLQAARSPQPAQTQSRPTPPPGFAQLVTGTPTATAPPPAAASAPKAAGGTGSEGNVEVTPETSDEEDNSRNAGSGPEVQHGLMALRGVKLSSVNKAAAKDGDPAPEDKDGKSLFDACAQIWFLSNRMYLLDRTGHLQPRDEAWFDLSLRLRTAARRRVLPQAWR